jgi:hypothetical protein
MIFLTPSHWLKKYLIGKTGIDTLSRVVVIRALKEKGLKNDDELKEALISSLPIYYADRFINSTIWITIVLLVLFAIICPMAIVLFVFGIHDLFDAPWSFLNYPLLVVQWIIAYLFFSVVASLLMAFIATFAYSNRVSRAIKKDYLR